MTVTAATIESFTGEYAFLSNFYAWSLTYQGRTYRSAEHAFQAAKAPHEKARQYIAEAATPKEAKERGHKVYLARGWEQRRDKVMLGVLRAKFKDPLLRDSLLETGEVELVEGNRWHDLYWGRCQCYRHAGAGENRLGQLLMQVRSELRKGIG